MLVMQLQQPWLGISKHLSRRDSNPLIRARPPPTSIVVGMEHSATSRFTLFWPWIPVSFYGMQWPQCLLNHCFLRTLANSLSEFSRNPNFPEHKHRLNTRYAPPTQQKCDDVFPSPSYTSLPLETRSLAAEELKARLCRFSIDTVAFTYGVEYTALLVFLPPYSVERGGDSGGPNSVGDARPSIMSAEERSSFLQLANIVHDACEKVEWHSLVDLAMEESCLGHFSRIVRN
jgi:hypothetical protein